MEEPSFLMSVNRIIGRIQIENDLKWRSLVRVHEMIDHQPIDRFRLHHDLLVPVPGEFHILQHLGPINAWAKGQSSSRYRAALRKSAEKVNQWKNCYSLSNYL